MQRGRGNIGARLRQFLRPFSGRTFWGFVLRRRWLPVLWRRCLFDRSIFGPLRRSRWGCMPEKQRPGTMAILPEERVEQDDGERHRKKSEDEVGGKMCAAPPKRARGVRFWRAQLLPNAFQF